MAVYRNFIAIIRIILPGLILCVLSLWAAPLCAVDSVTKPAAGNRQADVVHNLCKFVAWPKEAFDSSDVFYIYLKNNADAESALMGLTDRPLSQRKIRVRRMLGVKPPFPCHVLFIHACSDAVMQKMLDIVKDRPILTISPRPGFTGQGGMIELIATSDRVRFHINLDAAKTAGLVIKAPLLQIAEDIRGLDQPVSVQP